MFDRARSVAARRLREPETIVFAAFAACVAVGFTWGLPSSQTWAADSISPRSCGLGAIVEMYTPGHFQHYSPLQMALMTVLSLPWMAAAASRVGLGIDALGEELIHPVYMTGIEVSARLLTAAMALGILGGTMRLWTRMAGRRVGLYAGAAAAANAAFVYYAHTGNLDVPSVFWVTWTLVELDRVMAGESREGRALLCAAAAVLTKDQTAGALLAPVPLSLLAVPWLVRRASPLRPRLWRGFAVAAGVYLLVSGAVVNPTGFSRRLAELFGPASQSWAEYPRGVGGALSLTQDALAKIPIMSSWPIAAGAVVGVALVCIRRRGVDRARALMPAVAGVSFAALFTYAARRSDERFLLPESVLIAPYAAIALDALRTNWGRPAVVAGALAGLGPAFVSVASMDGTLLADSRYTAERFLAALPESTRVEVLGGPIFLPRVPDRLEAVRPGVEPIEDRQRIAGIHELIDPAMDPRPRHPDVIVLATELSNLESARTDVGAHPYGLMSYRDPVSRRLLHALLDGSYGYRRVLRANCSLPWPLTCRELHGSTGREVWVYARPP